LQSNILHLSDFDALPIQLRLSGTQPAHDWGHRFEGRVRAEHSGWKGKGHLALLTVLTPKPAFIGLLKKFSQNYTPVYKPAFATFDNHTPRAKKGWGSQRLDSCEGAARLGFPAPFFKNCFSRMGNLEQNSWATITRSPARCPAHRHLQPNQAAFHGGARTRYRERRIFVTQDFRAYYYVPGEGAPTVGEAGPG